MTTSRLPWVLEGAHTGLGCYLKASDGRIIATFLDHRDADLVLENLCNKEKWTISELLEKNEELEEDNKSFEVENDELTDRVVALEAKLEALKSGKV